ncbi:hypothetical protein SAMN05443144_11381 [Fodinibius roseus]|uniref:NnrS protein n=1 Tax=Fodinibius roseus TaxID=1194090 RepID=A0A1M5EJQ9_9BACT|nr:hypothetical protein [Fodinibius roseus]SHF79479.1 hypothetical protein SAMN05443144_11381 [Fodinibius roseus]
MTSRKASTYILVSLLAVAAIGLLSGLHAGLVRLGFLAGTASVISPMAHGPLMINGFLGALIGLERAAALEKKWAYMAPLLLGFSTILVLSGFTFPAKLLVIAGSLSLLAIMLYLYNMQPVAHHLIMALGAAALLVGNILFLFDMPIFNLVAWWAGFPLLTIFGERLELNRIMRPPKRAQHLFVALIAVWITAIAFTHLNRPIGWAAASVSLIAQAGWLFKYDVARRTIRSVEWTRYSAISLLTGYGWLVLAGLFSLWQGFPTAGPLYDALLHMIFVGFVFSMIFAHASVIIPSLSGKLVPYHPYFYGPLLLLHGFLLIRVAGDLFWLPAVRKAGSYGNVAAILLFLGGILFFLLWDALRKRRQRSMNQNKHA